MESARRMSVSPICPQFWPHHSWGLRCCHREAVGDRVAACTRPPPPGRPRALLPTSTAPSSSHRRPRASAGAAPPPPFSPQLCALPRSGAALQLRVCPASMGSAVPLHCALPPSPPPQSGWGRAPPRPWGNATVPPPTTGNGLVAWASRAHVSAARVTGTRSVMVGRGANRGRRERWGWSLTDRIPHVIRRWGLKFGCCCWSWSSIWVPEEMGADPICPLGVWIWVPLLEILLHSSLRLVSLY